MADQEKQKGFSLRKRGGGRRHQVQQPDLPKTSDDKPRHALKESYGTNEIPNDQTASTKQRPQLGGQTSNLIKKRYSIRYNQLPGLNDPDAPPVPGIPNFQRALAQHFSSREGSPARQQGVDIRVLRDPSLQAEEYVTKFLTNASEQDIIEYQQSLKKVKNRASTDLQHNVYQNRTQFIKISKEAEKLKGEMQTLRGLMSELTTTLAQTSVSSSTGRRSPSFDEGSSSARKRANRSSVANLEAMWTTQLQVLWKNIEGSQKFLPAIPGRHVVQESGYWVELDAATWKPRRPVHMVLLNDHLLIATRKRKRVDPSMAATQKAPTKLVAERCWPLYDIDLVDLALGAKEIKGPFRETKDISNAITVRQGQESFTYYSDRADAKEKTDLLLAFKRTVDELRRAERAEVDEMGKTKDTLNYAHPRNPSISRGPNLMEPLGRSRDRPDILIDVDGKQRSLRWVESQIDELDIEIALQRFEEAVTRVEQLRRLAKGLKNNIVAQNFVVAKVDERVSKLADLITTLLIQTHNFPTPTAMHITHLTRLQLTALARTTYLAARTDILTLRARQCVFEGDLESHVTALSYVYMTLIKNTVSVYQQCFPTNMMSACVVWAREMMARWEKGLERALSSVTKGGEVWTRCVGVAREMADGLGEVGLGFGGLIDSDLLRDKDA